MVLATALIHCNHQLQNGSLIFGVIQKMHVACEVEI